MYTKVFRSIYDGTLADNWQAMVTFQQLLILADSDGVVDMTAGAIARTTGIPIEILSAGIERLEAPDPLSRTPDMEGRRIARLDPHRPWGWFLVNFKKYKEMRHREEKREADRERMATKREALRKDATVRDMSQIVAEVAYTDIDKDLDKKSIAPNGAVSSADDKMKKSDRLTAVTEQAISAFNAALSVKAGGLLSAVTMCTDKRKAQVKRIVKLAAMACDRLYGSPTVTPDFWKEYFEEVSRDDFKSGRGPYTNGHANWKPDFEYLTRPEVVEKVIDDALSRMPA